jgi:hypothetical protein
VRLRSLGGILLIDFIDMQEEHHRRWRRCSGERQRITPFTSAASRSMGWPRRPSPDSARGR